MAIDPAPIRGVLRTPPAQLRSALPVLRNPANRKRAVSLTPEQFRNAFGNALPAEESARLHEQWTIPGPGQAAVPGRARQHDPPVSGRDGRRHPHGPSARRS